jgi:hypothetical protein
MEKPVEVQTPGELLIAVAVLMVLGAFLLQEFLRNNDSYVKFVAGLRMMIGGLVGY